MSGDVRGEFGVTIYGNASKAIRLLAGAGATLQCVMLHTWPDPTDAPAVKAVQAAFPGAKLDFGVPGNTLSDDTKAELQAKARQAVKSATDFGARFLQLNCEKAEKAGYPGWGINSQADSDRLFAQARMVVEVFAEEIDRARSPLKLSFTSHDWPVTHKLPWDAFLGHLSPVVAHDPQVYPGVKRPGASFKAVRSRLAKTRAQWAKFSMTVKPSLLPGIQGDGEDSDPQQGMGTYHQAWGMSPMSMIFLGTRTFRSRMWSFPDDMWTVEGLLSAFVLGHLRDAYPEAVNPVRDFQKAQLFVPAYVDGIFGKKSLRAFFEAVPEFSLLACKVLNVASRDAALTALESIW